MPQPVFAHIQVTTGFADIPKYHWCTWLHGIDCILTVIDQTPIGFISDKLLSRTVDPRDNSDLTFKILKKKIFRNRELQ